MKLVKEMGYEKNEFFYNIFNDEGTEVGYAEVVVQGDDLDEAYVADIFINEEYRNQGLGTATLKALVDEYWLVFLAPTNEDNQRLYERLGEEMTGDVPEVDQGYGVYELA